MKKQILFLSASLLSLSTIAQIAPGPAAAPIPVQGPQPVQGPGPVQGPQAVQAYVPPVNSDGGNQLVYIDEMGQPKTAVANSPMAQYQQGDGIITVQWAVYYSNGAPMNQMADRFTYRGNNGQGYESRIVALPSDDPYKAYDVHFQSRRIGYDQFRDSRVIILDWQNNPWLVKVEYSNDRGLYFKFIPYQDR